MKSHKNRRLFRRHRRRRATMLALFAIIVGGCAQTVGDWTPAQAPRDLQVQWVTLEHPIAFNAQSSQLDRLEARRLDRFLSGIELRPSDRLYVDVGPGAADVLDEERIGAINERLRHYIPAANAAPVAGGRGGDGSARLIVGRYVVLPPNCPNWSRPSSSNPGNVNDGNFGCATQTNLGLMVADPADLLRGRTLSPADGEALSGGIRRYRAGEIKKPKRLKVD